MLFKTGEFSVASAPTNNTRAGGSMNSMETVEVANCDMNVTIGNVASNADVASNVDAAIGATDAGKRNVVG